MTNQTNASLIAENRKWVRLHRENEYQAEAARRMTLVLAALEAAEKRAEDAEAGRTTGNASLYRALSDRLRALIQLSDELEAMRIERDNWKLSAEEAERAEKRWKDRAVEAERERGRLDEAFDRDLPWRYDEVETQRNQLAAVVEKVRAEVEGENGWFRHRARRVLDILATAPDDALREHDARVWDEGFEAGWAEKEDPGAFVNDVWDAKTPNPYREGQS